MPDDAGTPPLLTDFSARLAAAREEGRREVLDVVRAQLRAFETKPGGSSAVRALSTVLYTCNSYEVARIASDALPAVEAQHE